MKQLRKTIARLLRKVTLTPEQSDQLAQIKFPCC